MVNAKECMFAKIEIKHVVKRERNKTDLQKNVDKKFRLWYSSIIIVVGKPDRFMQGYGG